MRSEYHWHCMRVNCEQKVCTFVYVSSTGGRGTGDKRVPNTAMGNRRIKGSFLFELNGNFFVFVSAFGQNVRFEKYINEKFAIPSGNSIRTRRKKNCDQQCNVNKRNSNGCSFNDNIINFLLLCCSSKRPPENIYQRLLICLFLHVLLCVFLCVCVCADNATNNKE